MRDEELLTQARAGDRQALEQLLERHQAEVYRFSMRMCRDPDDAKDVLQDTLLAVARGVRAFRGESSLSTWLYTIARSFCIKRRRTAPASAQVMDETPDPAKHPDEALAGKEVELAIEQAIGALEPMYREVLLLRDVEGLSASEVAEVLGLSSAAVKSRLHRARLAVRAQVAPLLGVPETQPGCPDVLSLFSRHLEGEISAPVCADMERHLASCARCRGACDSLKRTLALCQRTAPGVPDAVQARVKVALRDFLDEKAEPFAAGLAPTCMEATMKTVQVTEKTFDATVKQGIVLLDFWAAWCGPCRAFAPTFEAAAARHPDVVFGKIDTEAEPGLAGAFQIRAIPTLVVLRDGVVLAAQPGVLSAAMLDELVGKVRALDMEKVRQSIEAPAAPAGGA